MSAESRADSYIAADLQVEGKVEGRGNLRVAGQVKGHIALRGEITVEPGGLVDAEVRASTLTLSRGARMRGRVDFGGEEA
jgi:cytoskeletal protein CcmA (bactofilin family)